MFHAHSLQKTNQVSTPDYFFLWLQSPAFIDNIAPGRSNGVPHISAKEVHSLQIRVPSCEEQHRIIARVDELMALCDTLEAKQKARGKLREKLRASALDALMHAESDADLEQAWDRIHNNWDHLTNHPDSVDALRQAILQLAVRGKLVPQDPKDEPANVLLERLTEEKTRLVKEKKIRKPKLIPPFDETQLPFTAPAGWAWIQAGKLFQLVTSGSRGWAKYYDDNGPIFLRIGNLDYGTTKLDLVKLQCVNPPKGAEGSRTRTQPEDILVSITGDTGMVGLIPDDFGEAYINQHIALCRPLSGLWPAYVATIFTAQLVLIQLWGYQRGIKNSLGLDDIRKLVIPLPPLAEQHRIVVKVDEMMETCDRLEDHLRRTFWTAEAFAAAAVHHLEV